MAINRSGIAGLLDSSKNESNTYGTRLKSIVEETSPIYEEIIRGTASDPEERRRQAQAQALFALAQTGLAFASPTQAEIAAGRRFSPAERLAQSIEQTKLFPTIAALGAQEQKAKDAERKAIQAARLSALSSAEQKLTAETKLRDDLKREQIKSALTKNVAAFQKSLEINNNLTLEKAKAKSAKELSRLNSRLDTVRQQTIEAQKAGNQKEQIRLRGEQDRITQDKQQLFTRERDETLNAFRIALNNQNADIQTNLQILKGNQTLEAQAKRAEYESALQENRFRLRSIENERAFRNKLDLQANRQQFQAIEAAADREIKLLDIELKEAQGEAKIKLEERRVAALERKQKASERREKLKEQVGLVKDAATAVPVLLAEKRKTKDGRTITTGELFANGTLNEDETRRIESLVSAALSGKYQWDGQKNVLTMPGFSPEVAQQIIDYQNNTGRLRPIQVNALQARVFGTGPDSKREIKEKIMSEPIPSFIDEARKQLKMKKGRIYDAIYTSVGTQGLILKGLNTILEGTGFAALIGTPDDGDSAVVGAAVLDTLKKELLGALLQATTGKDNKQLQDLFLSFAPDAASAVQGLQAVQAKIGTLLSKLNVEEVIIQKALEDKQLDKTEYAKRLGALRSLKSLKNDYARVLQALQNRSTR